MVVLGGLRFLMGEVTLLCKRANILSEALRALVKGSPVLPLFVPLFLHPVPLRLVYSGGPS